MRAPTYSWAAIAFSLTLAAHAADDEQRAREAFREGVARYKAGENEAALASFREAYALQPIWKLLYNIGQCEAALKRHGLALAAFERYLSEGGDEVPGERQDDVIAEVKRLRVMVGSLEVEGPKGATVEVNGVDRGTLPAAGRLKVAMGRLEVRVLVDGEPVHDSVLSISGGDTLRVEVDEQPEELAAPPPPEPEEEVEAEDADAGRPPEPSRRRRVFHGLAYGAWGLASGALTAGVMFAGIASSEHEKLRQDCGDDKTCDPSLKPKAKQVREQALAADLNLGAAAALTVLGAVFYWALGGPDEREGEAEVTVSPTADGAGVVLGIGGEL